MTGISVFGNRKQPPPMIVIALLLCLAWYMVTTLIPMPAPAKTVFTILCAFALVWLFLAIFGVVPAPHLHLVN